MGDVMTLIHHYLFWLFLISALCFVLERFFPWRLGQKADRDEIWQDFFWLIFNGHIFGILFAIGYNTINGGIDSLYSRIFGNLPTNVSLLSESSFVVQFVAVLFIGDFIEWAVHYSLHRFLPLWKFHRMHHSIKTMDWIGNFRFHWFESIYYNTIKYLPLALLGIGGPVLLTAGVFSTLIGHLNHSNLNISYGPLRYVFNSPRMHIWHHEKELRRPHGVNFGIVFSIWDWLFRTAYMPTEGPLQPEVIGYHGEEHVSNGIMQRFFVPFLDTK